jgi:hypothetical protein
MSSEVTSKSVRKVCDHCRRRSGCFPPRLYCLALTINSRNKMRWKFSLQSMRKCSAELQERTCSKEKRPEKGQWQGYK